MDVRRILIALAALGLLAGCSSGGDKIEPSAKNSGSPILNRAAAQPPAQHP